MQKGPRRPLSEKNAYHLDKYREMEIYYFCLQYDGWKKRLNEIRFKGSSDEWCDVTGEEAVERVMLERKISMVEEACLRADPENSAFLLKGVTDPLSTFNNFKLVKGIKCGRDKYYTLKHKVYFLISQEKHLF